MVTGLEILLLALVLAAIVGASRVIQAVRPFIVNAIVGLIALFLAQAVFDISVAITPIALLVVALGGLPGSILVILLSVLEIAFV